MPRKQKKEEKPAKLFTLDTETRGLFGKVFRVGLYDGQKYYAADTTEQILQILKNESRHHECHVFIHNLDFDIAKMAKEFLPLADLNKSVVINNNIVIFRTHNAIILHDSLRLLPSSLEKLSKDFGLQDEGKFDLSEHLKANGYKDKEDYFMRVEPHEEVLNYYLKYDCISLHKIISEVINISGLSLKDFLKCPTAASLAMKVYQTRFKDDYEVAISSNYKGEWGLFVEEVIRLAYYGGRTEVFIPELHEGYHYDINSLYPYVMGKAGFEYPVGWYDVFLDKQANNVFNKWLKSGKGAGFAWVDVVVPDTLNIPPLPYKLLYDKKSKLSGKLLFPVGNLTGVWTFPELKMALKYGCKIEKVHEVVYFEKTAPVFKNYIEEYEKLKIYATENHKPSLRTFSKLLQNSLYGKFGQRRKQEEYLDDTPENRAKLDAQDKHYREYHHAYMNKGFLVTGKLSLAEYIQVHLAAYVTSYARIYLYESIQEQLRQGARVAYCDTDSMATTKQFEDEWVHDSIYGKWKLENVLEHAIFLQPKLYMEKPNMVKIEKEFPELYEEMTKGLKKNFGEQYRQHFDKLNTYKAKGIPKDVMKKYNEQTYMEWLQDMQDGTKERIEVFKDRKVRQKFMTLLKNNQDFDQDDTIRKSIKVGAIQKRVIDFKNNTSYPHKLDDFGENYVARMQEEIAEENLLYLEKWERENDTLKEWIDQIGYIETEKPGTVYYEDYKKIPRSNVQKYFRSKGVAIDVFADIMGISVNDLLEKLQRGA